MALERANFNFSYRGESPIRVNILSGNGLCVCPFYSLTPFLQIRSTSGGVSIKLYVLVLIACYLISTIANYQPLFHLGFFANRQCILFCCAVRHTLWFRLLRGECRFTRKFTPLSEQARCLFVGSGNQFTDRLVLFTNWHRRE